ncbi:MAG TPA: choice-of-anchor Q domain-containing protein [Gemmataceae bacterium]|nr:choice-of-anchor Q domain-containing protein [Gemmataceae bacterium]
MSRFSVLRWFRNAAPKQPLPRTQLTLDVLEDRLAPATLTVNTLADISIAAGVNPATGVIHGTNLVTLRSAIDAANQTPGGDVIHVAKAGTYSISQAGANTGTDATGAFAILANGGNLSIVNTSGGAVTVNGNHLDRVFDINPTFNPANPSAPFTVTMQGFTITGGEAAGDDAAGSGGGIRDIGNASLTLTNMVVTNNTATADGGGISMENTVSVPWTLTVNNSTISNNHAGDAGGGIDTDGAGKIFLNPGTVITGNSSVNQGGGIWLDAIGDGAVTGVTLINQGSNRYGPPIGFPSVVFTSQDGKGSGATGVINAGNVDMGGLPTSVTVTNPGIGYDLPPLVSFSFANPTNIVAVATINPIQSATLTVNGATISNNQALTGPGGGIGNAGPSTVTITHSTVSNNTAGAVGGGFGDENSYGNLVVTTSLFLNNVAGGNGGAIYEAGPTTSITSSQISGNASGDQGGGVYAGGTTLFVLNSTLSNNTAAGDPNNDSGGGAITLVANGAGLNASSIISTTITGNRAVNNHGSIGGGIDASGFRGDLALTNDTISANVAEFGGGVIWESNTGSVAVQNSIIAGNFGRIGVDLLGAPLPVIDRGGNVIGVAGDLNKGFTAATTLVGSLVSPLDPRLAPLGKYRGPTIGAAGSSQMLQTEALFAGSPAIDAGILSRAPAFDERGFAAEVNGVMDAGAVDAVVAAPTVMTRVMPVKMPIQQTKVNGVATTIYYVNSTLDTHAPAAGDLTLREAIDLANQTPGIKIIELLVPGTYKITLAGANTGTNASGAFAILPSGGNVSIVNDSHGAVTIDGNRLDRVFDINPGDDVSPNDRFTVTLQGITITGGLARLANGLVPENGGGIQAQGVASLTLNSVTVTDNIASGDGGGIAMTNTVSALWTLTINSSTISNNHAGDAGGGIETDGGGKVFVNTGSFVTGNTSVNEGAGIWLDAITTGSPAAAGTVASVTITNPGTATFGSILGFPSVFFTSQDGKGSGAAGLLVTDANGVPIGVTITNAGSGYDLPPLVSFTFPYFTPDIVAVATLTPLEQGADLTVNGVTIQGNTSLTAAGGGIGNAGNGSVSIVGSTIQRNFAAGGGGGFADTNDQGSLSIATSLILNNIAGGPGGGILEGGPSTTINNIYIAGNLSGGPGGGIFANGANLTLLNTTIANNTAGGDGNGLGGGGIELQTTGASTVTSTTITGNRALNADGANGGAIDAAKLVGSVALVNDTINANLATTGGGIFWGGFADSFFSLENTILAQNFLANAPVGWDAVNPTNIFTDLGGNIFGITDDANLGLASVPTSKTGSFNNPLNPSLDPLGNYGGPLLGAPGSTMTLFTEALHPGSPAIGHGVNAGAPTNDARGVKNKPPISAGAVNAVV